MSLDNVLTIGVKLRAARLQKKLSLRDLAVRADVSPSLLSQIENGKSNPSVLTLHNIATALEVPITYFFPDPEVNGRPSRHMVLTRDEKSSGALLRNAYDAPVPEQYSPVLHPNARVAIELMDGIRWERLTPDDVDRIQFLEIHYPPGATSGPALSRHSGKEFGFVLAGKLTLELGTERYTLTTEDSIIFDSSTPHRLLNEGVETVRAIWVDMYPSN